LVGNVKKEIASIIADVSGYGEAEMKPESHFSTTWKEIP
jgi:hypothetical protein